MKIKINREDSFIDVDRVVIKIGDEEFRVSVSDLNHLVVNKFSFNNNTINITPNSNSEIRIK